MNEPVGIVKKITIGGIDNFPIEQFVRLKEGTLLYTHPVKEQLTNTEIADALYVADITLDNLSDGDIPIERINAFAGAILRKAQEK